MQGISHSQSFRTACSEPYFGAFPVSPGWIPGLILRSSAEPPDRFAITFLHDSQTFRSYERILDLILRRSDLTGSPLGLEALTRIVSSSHCCSTVCSSQSAHVCMSSKTSTDFDTLYHSGVIPPKGGARTATGAHASETLCGIDGVYPSLDHIFWIQVGFFRRLNRSFARKTRSAHSIPAVRNLTLSTSKRCFSTSGLVGHPVRCTIPW